MQISFVRAALAVLVFFGGGLFTSQTAEAGDITGVTGTIRVTRDTTGTDAYAAGVGGEYKVTDFNGFATAPLGSGVQVGSGIFQTFCIEYNETISMGKTYDWTLNTEAVQGGVGGGNPDPLSAETAWLYTQFWNGTLDDYDYNLGVGNRADSADQIQHAIWYLEQEITSLDTSSQAWTWVTDAQSAVSSGNWSGLGGVRVLNVSQTLSDGTVRDRQDLLVIIPVPLPPAALAGFVMLGGLGLARLRKRRIETHA